MLKKILFFTLLFHLIGFINIASSEIIPLKKPKQTSEETEKKLDYERGFYKFIDLETNSEIEINPNDIKKLYRKEIKESLDYIKEKSAQLKIDYFIADLNEGFERMLKAYLIKRSRLY